jgi:hypothetical protein
MKVDEFAGQYDPIGQAVGAEDPTGQKVPATKHRMQLLISLIPVFGLYVPAGHGVPVVELQKLPAGQVPHAVAPTVENRPAWHNSGVVIPDILQNAPKGHKKHDVEPRPGWNEPGKHDDALRLPIELTKNPDVANKHALAPVTGE